MPEEISKTELLYESTQRLVRTVDSLPDAAFTEPSGLPDWTRAHRLLDALPLPATTRAAARLALHRVRTLLPDA